MTNTTLDREIEGRLEEHEIRYTRGRRSVVTALASSDGPRSVAALHTQIGLGVPLSSLYRTLSVLEETGVVVHHFSASGVTRYELAEWLQGHHHHLVCTNCGSIDDVLLPRPSRAWSMTLSMRSAPSPLSRQVITNSRYTDSVHDVNKISCGQGQRSRSCLRLNGGPERIDI